MAETPTEKVTLAIAAIMDTDNFADAAAQMSALVHGAARALALIITVSSDRDAAISRGMTEACADEFRDATLAWIARIAAVPFTVNRDNGVQDIETPTAGSA